MRAGEIGASSSFTSTRHSLLPTTRIFVHVVGPDGQTVAQQDWQPLQNYAPTHLWHKGLRLVDYRYAIQLPADLAPGTYTVQVGMYTDAGRLPVTRNGEPAGDYAVAGTFEVP